MQAPGNKNILGAPHYLLLGSLVASSPCVHFEADQDFVPRSLGPPGSRACLIYLGTQFIQQSLNISWASS